MISHARAVVLNYFRDMQPKEEVQYPLSAISASQYCPTSTCYVFGLVGLEWSGSEDTKLLLVHIRVISVLDCLSGDQIENSVIQLVTRQDWVFSACH